MMFYSQRKVKDENGMNVLAEASFRGVVVRPLLERVRRSSASQICVRRLQVTTLPAHRRLLGTITTRLRAVRHKLGGRTLQYIASTCI